MSSLASNEIAGQESEFAKAFNIAQEYLSHRGRLGPFYWLANTPKFWRACKTSHAFVDAAVQRALDSVEKTESNSAEPSKQYVFISALVRETRDKIALQDQCLNILVASRDTTACCLTWTLRLLSRHQHVLSKLRAEVESVVGLGQDALSPTREQLKKIKYLNLVLKEVLRLYLSVPINSRTAVKTTTLPTGGGADGQAPIIIWKGEAVSYCVYAMHRRQDLYGEDAMDFVPERWQDGRLAREIGYGYLPFNGGPRLCLGQEFALLEAGYAVTRIIQRFPYISVPKNKEVAKVRKEKQNLTLVLAPTYSCRVKLVHKL